MAANFRYPAGTPSTGGVDGVITSLQEKIRRQTDPKHPPEGFKADPWVIPTSLWSKAQTTEIQNFANAEAIRQDTADLRTNFEIEAFRTFAAGKFKPTQYRPLTESERANIRERQRVQTTLDAIREQHPGVAAPVEWDDGTQAIFDHFNEQESLRKYEGLTFQEAFPATTSGPLFERRGKADPHEVALWRRANGKEGPKPVLDGITAAIGQAFDGRSFIKELTTWTTAYAADPTLNPEDWARNKAAWEPEFDAMYEDLPRPAQIFIEEMNPGNVAITLASGGLSTVLRASGSPIARGVAKVLAPIAGPQGVSLEIAASTGARVGYEETDGAPLPIRLAVGAAAAALIANPRAITSPTGKAVKQAWTGLTEPPNVGGMAPNPQGTTLGGVFAPTPGAARSSTDTLVPIPDVIDVKVPDALSSYRSPVNYGAPELAATALDRAADLQRQIGLAATPGSTYGPGVPGNAAHALARAQDALEFSGNNRFVNALNRATDDPIIRQSYWAEQAASSEYAARVFPSRIKFLDYLERTFGSTRNLPDSFEYVGPETRRLHGQGFSGPRGGNQVPAAEHPLTGTIYDRMMNPDYYATPEGFSEETFRNHLQWYNRRNLRANQALRGYGAEIGDFATTTDDFFFPTINRQSQIASIKDPDAAAMAVSGRLRERQFSSIDQRFMLPLEEQGGVFDPELDYAVAFTALDNAKAMGAGRNTFRLGLGGSLEPREGWIEVPALSNELQKIYLPEAQAQQVARYFDQGDGVKVFNWLNILKNTALNADASPLTIQGSLAWFASPFDTTAQLLGAAKKGETFRAFTPEFLAEQVAADPKGWTDFSFWMGMSPNAGTPAEFRTGLLEAIPRIGPKLGEWNDNVMSVLMQWMKREFTDQSSALVKEGWSQEQAFAAAADVVRMIVPMTDTRKLGITATGNILQRAAVTSASFIRQPIQFMDDAFTGYLKLGLKVPDEMLGTIRRGGRRIEDVIPERQALQVELESAAGRIDEINAEMARLPRGLAPSADDVSAAQSALRRAEMNLSRQEFRAGQPGRETRVQVAEREALAAQDDYQAAWQAYNLSDSDANADLLRRAKENVDNSTRRWQRELQQAPKPSAAPSADPVAEARAAAEAARAEVERLSSMSDFEATHSSLRAERNAIANSIKTMQPDLDTLLQEESALRLSGRQFSGGTREAWATLTPRERAAAQTFAKMTGSITGVAATSAMLTAESRGLTPEEALQRALPGQPDFWKVFLGSEFSVSVGGPLRSLAQAIMPGENGIPFENIPQYAHSKLTPPLSALEDLIQNEDYYGQEIRSGNFASQVFDSLAYAARQVAPVSVTTPIELADKGYSATQILAQATGQFLGQNLLPPSHYERLERIRRTTARDLLANPETWESMGMTQDQMDAAKSARNLTELRQAIGTRAANHLVEFGNPEAEEALEAYTTELRRRADGGDRDAEALLISIDTQEQLEAQRQLSVDANGVLDKALYRSQRGQIIARMVGQNDAFRDVFEGFGRSDNEVDRLSAEWYELFDRASVIVEVDGKDVVAGVDYDLFQQLEDQFFADLGPEKAALVEANVAVAPRGANPAEMELRQTRRDLELAGYWDIEAEVWGSVRKGAISTVTQLMEAGQLGDRIQTDEAKELTASLLTAPTYGDFRTKVKEVLTEQFIEAGIKPETAVQIAKQKLGALPDIRAIDGAISDKKVEWALANPELAEGAIQWGYLSASEANIAATQFERQQPAADAPAEDAASEQQIQDAFKAPESFQPKRSSSSELTRMATDFTEHGLSYSDLAEKYGLSSKGAAEQRLRRHFGESPAAVRDRLRESLP